ncbi:DUF4405 domain-containing protein [Heliorestis convoluta]|uniref:Flavinylation-associated cytochrome domain-containing protein n=1 Tax=Heliorestis convoluta TaxID=356322 RepID=A0A5Q2N2H1_9FIRM|nr:DUF4405 domain-containing protein [Heliorestis convoluta]QGG48069.1 hypothetical protein FTV88_1971 [Heliorestis convoluta]
MKDFNMRSFVSLTLTVSLILLVFTGVVLYIAPAGRIANWTNWVIFGLSKETHQAIHTTSSFLFVFFSAWHIVLNGKAILCYMKNKARKTVIFTKEMVAALALVVFFFVSTQYNVPPVSMIMEIGDSLKASWEEKAQNPPFSQAESVPLEDFAKYLDSTENEVVTLLEQSGIVVQDNEMTLEEIAKENNMSPQQIYEQVEKQGLQVVDKEYRSGQGSKTIAQLAEEHEIPVEVALQRLQEKGIQASASTRLQEIALQQNLTSHDAIILITEP